jgi:hypothetical protein
LAAIDAHHFRRKGAGPEQRRENIVQCCAVALDVAMLPDGGLDFALISYMAGD